MYHPLPDFLMAAIDCGRLHGICDNLEGTTTPSVRYFPPSQKTGILYTGERELAPLAEWVLNVTKIEPYTVAESLLFVAPSEVEKVMAEGGWILVVVDNHREHVYNHTVVRNCEERWEIQFRAVSNVDYRKEAARYCRNSSNNCVFLSNGEQSFEFTGDVNDQEIGDFLEGNLPAEL
jgi:hypothetical protein